MAKTSQMGTVSAVAEMREPIAMSRLLATLHFGIFDEPPWSSFLRTLRLSTNAHYANLVFRRRDAPMNEVTAFFDGDSPSDALSFRYMEQLYRIDPLPYHLLKTGQVFSLPDVIGEQTEATRTFIQEFLEPAGIRYLRIVKVSEPNGFQAWLTISRRDAEFGAEAGKLLALVAEHLAIALRAYSRIEAERQHGAIYEAAVGRLNVGVMTLAADGEVLGRDARAMQLLASDSPLSLDVKGKLLVHPQPARRSLSAALKERRGGMEGRPRAIHICDVPRIDMLLVPYGEPAVSGERTPVLTCYIHAGATTPVGRADQLRELFGLTRTEARLALALSEGRTIARAAIELGLTIETARNYSKRIFQKTATNRQAELVRLILTSVVALG